MAEVDLYSRSPESIKDPPKTFGETLKYLGPGLILVGSIVGSGELVMTTKLGAKAGFTMMWFVILSCIIKVVVQVELVRHVISSGQTILEIGNRFPGPSWRRPAWFTLDWLVWFIILLYAGITVYMRRVRHFKLLHDSENEVAGVVHPGELTSDTIYLVAFGVLMISMIACILKAILSKKQKGEAREDLARPRINWFFWIWILCQIGMFINGGAILGGAGQSLELAFPFLSATSWSVIVGLVSAVLLVGGGYTFLERISLAMVSLFTAISVVCAVILQWTEFRVSGSQIFSGMTFSLPPGESLTTPMILVILAVYAATGIGHWEMLSYTYWCIEKGYARFTGECTTKGEEGDAWVERAQGWVRVMYIDALLTMVVYTLSTICFYLLGAAILYAKQLDPAASDTLKILQSLYTDSLGDWAAWLFIIGAFFVLFSTTISSTASASRILSDALTVLGFLDRYDSKARMRAIRICIVVSLAMNAYAYFIFKDPPLMLMLSGLIAIFMYPTMGIGTIYLRYRGVDERIRPGGVITSLLWISGGALAIISPVLGIWVLILKMKG